MWQIRVGAMSDTSYSVERLVDQEVVLDLASPYVVIGTLAHADQQYLELTEADLHDLRDSRTTRDQYVAEARQSGIKVNRKRLMIPRNQVVGMALLSDVVT